MINEIRDDDNVGGGGGKRGKNKNEKCIVF